MSTARKIYLSKYKASLEPKPGKVIHLRHVFITICKFACDSKRGFPNLAIQLLAAVGGKEARIILTHSYVHTQCVCMCVCCACIIVISID